MFVTLEKAAVLLDLDDGIVKALVESGHLGAIRAGKGWKIPEAALAAFEASVAASAKPWQLGALVVDGQVYAPGKRRAA